MNQSEKNRKFLIKYYRHMQFASQQGPEAMNEAIHKYISNQKLIEHIAFFKNSFPDYDLTVEEIIAEGDKVYVRVNFIGTHTGESDEIPATNKEVEVPFALCYTIKDQKIVDFWAIANEMEFFEQLGTSRDQMEVRK